MTGPPQAAGFFAIDKDILARDEAALVCSVVLDVLHGDVTRVCLDAYSDYDDEMPQEIRDAQAALTQIGAKQHRRDPGMGIELDLSDPAHARLLDMFAPWSINVDLLGPQRLDMGAFHDCAMWVHFRASAEQAARIGNRLSTVGPVVSASVFDEQRRQDRRAKWVGRRAVVRKRACGLAQRVPWVGKTQGWPTVTPPTVPPAGPPEFESDHEQAPPEE